MLKPTQRVNEPTAHRARESTLRALFDSQESPLLRYAFSLVGRRAVAEEIVQEVFLQLHVHWDNVESPQQWLFRSVRNKSFNYIRDNKRMVLSMDEQQIQNASDESQTQLERMETTGSLREMVRELNESDRQLVELKYFQGLKYREISDKTGLSVSNVGYRLHHILKELAEKLRPLGIDGKS